MEEDEKVEIIEGEDLGEQIEELTPEMEEELSNGGNEGDEEE